MKNECGRSREEKYRLRDTSVKSHDNNHDNNISNEFSQCLKNGEH